jgi:2,3-bisphosphoglycerate-independent phosphoglycerate mutase
VNAAKTIVFLGDGMADEPIPSLNNRTPLQAARTPWMDRIAREGRCGTLLTLPEGYPTSSDVANMSVLGCDLAREFTGRGPLEALGQGIVLGPADIALRLNLIAVRDGILQDHSAGHISQEEASILIGDLSEHFDNDEARFYTGVSYRNILVLSGAQHSDKVYAEKPDENHGNRVVDHLPQARVPMAAHTETLLRHLIAEAPSVLENHPVNRARRERGLLPANGVWPWSPGRAGAIRSLRQRHGVSGAVISAVDVINGLGRALGMEVIRVPGATGYIDTNYEGKADAALEALKRHDFVYVHIEGTDEVSHEKNLEKKLQAIEDFDARLIGRVMAAAGDRINVAVLPDHPVPIRLGVHTRTPVPVAVRMQGVEPDRVQTYDEAACPAGALGAMRGDDLMALLLGRASEA